MRRKTSSFDMKINDVKLYSSLRDFILAFFALRVFLEFIDAISRLNFIHGAFMRKTSDCILRQESLVMNMKTENSFIGKSDYSRSQCDLRLVARFYLVSRVELYCCRNAAIFTRLLHYAKCLISDA